jgi:hypothetical protein
MTMERLTRRCPDLRLDLTVPAQWERIEAVREVVARCLTLVFETQELRDAVAMVSAELLENAVKYGGAGPAIWFTLREERGVVLITVTHPTGRDPAHLSSLLDRVAWLRRFVSTREAYIAALASLYETEADNDVTVTGGLGIVRMAHEGGCALDVDTSQPGWLTVQASRPVSPLLEEAP